MLNKHIVVVSIDALVFEDLEYAKTLPTFKKIIDNGSIIQKVKTIYPTLTHPVHATLITGCPAGITKILSNERFIPGNLDRPWYNHLSEIDCKTIFHAAHEAGYTTASCRWPVTANGGDVIDYLIPEVMQLDKQGYEDNPLEVYKNLGTTECLMDIVENALNKYGFSNEHPVYDEFEIYCAAQIIRRYKPNLLFTHPGYVDNKRHTTGIFTDAVKEAIDVTDNWLSILMDAINDAGIMENTDIVLLSDHGQINITRSICPNVFLADAGFIDVTSNGEIKSWKAYTTSAGASAQVYLSNPDDEKLYNSVYELLIKMAQENIYGFETVLTKKECENRYGLSGDFSFVLETDGFTSFRDDWTRPVIRDLDITDYRYGKATHGYMPEKGPQPTFVAMGPSFKKGVILENGNVLNHAPTIAKALGLNMPWSVGKSVNEILKI